MNEFLKLAQRVSNSRTKTPNVVRLHPHVWQIPLGSDLAFLVECIAETTALGFQYHISFADKAADWIYSKKS